MSKRTARQWLINIGLLVISLSFMGISIAPLIGSMLSPAPAPSPTAVLDPAQQRKAELQAQLKGYQEVLKKEPKNEFVLKQTIQIMQELGDLKGSLEPLRTLADSYPDQPQYRYALAATYRQIDDRKNAKAELRKLLTTRPGYLDALQALVQMELDDNRPEAAIGAVKEVLDSAETANKIQPNSVSIADVQWILGNVYKQQNRYEEALAAYEAGIKADAQNFRSYVGKAEIKRLQGKADEANQLFDKAFELAPPQFKDRVKELKNQPSVVVEPVPQPTPSP